MRYLWLRPITLSAAIQVLAVTIVGGASGAMLFWEAQGQTVQNVGAVIGLLSTAVAVIGWYMSSRLNADAQRAQLHRQVLNDSRITLVRALRDTQQLLREPRGVLFAISVTKPDVPELRDKWAKALDELLGTPADWALALEEHLALFPELVTTVKQLRRFWGQLYADTRKIRDSARAAGALPPEFFEAAKSLVGKFLVQYALLEDLCIHIQNRAFTAITSDAAPNRLPADAGVPQLQMRDGQLVINVADPVKRLELINEGYLEAAHNP